MKSDEALSVLFFLAALCVASAAVWITLESIQITCAADGFGTVAITLYGAIPFGILSMLLVIVPSGIRYFRWHKGRDLASLWISAISFMAVAGDVLMFRIAPVHWHGF